MTKDKDDITWGDCSESQFLKQDDIVPPDGMIVTIERYERKLVSGNGMEPDKDKVCAEFKEFEKLLVLNSTNANAIKTFTRSMTPDESIGKQIEIYVDRTVTFGGKIVGGIRFRPIADNRY